MFRYNCALKKKYGCTARASVSSETEEPSFTLCDISTPYHHGEFHKPDTASNVADQLLVRMKREVEKNYFITSCQG